MILVIYILRMYRYENVHRQPFYKKPMNFQILIVCYKINVSTKLYLFEELMKECIEINS